MGKMLEMSDKLTIQNLAVREISPNPWNPNELAPDLVDKLKGSIRRNGFTLPIVVRLRKRGYQIIDGEHRWRAAQDLKLRHIPAIVLKLGAVAARELTINLNYLRGEPDWDKYARVLEQMVEQGLPREELAARLPITPAEVDDLLADAENQLDEAAEGIEDRRKEVDDKTNRLYTLSYGPFTLTEKQEIQEILAATAEQSEVQRLLACVRAYRE